MVLATMTTPHDSPDDDSGGSIADLVDQAVRPVIAQEGFDLVLVEYIPRGQVLRLYIDRDHAQPTAQAGAGPVGVSIDDCTQVSYLVSDLLDAEGLSDRIDGAFNLEVSSPGLDRPLVTPRHFRRFVGRQVKLATRGAVPGNDEKRRKFSGELQAADETADGAIVLAVDGNAVTLPYALIERARLVPEF